MPSSKPISTITPTSGTECMSDCMSSSPFDYDLIMKWFALEEPAAIQRQSSRESARGPVANETSPQSATESARKPAPALTGASVPSEPGLSQIPVMVGTEVVQLSVPIDLLCALLLTTGGAAPAHYTLQDVVLASDNLKRFRDVASTAATTAVPSALETPNPTAVPASGEVDIVSMALDANGSALVQEMIAKADEFERELIFSQLSATAVLVSINTHGCRVVQRALEFGTVEQNYALFKAIPPFKLVDLCMDVNGNHVMQKFVETLPPAALHEIVMVITDPATDYVALSTVARLSLHSYGCRVVQRLLVRCDADDRATLLGFIVAAFPELVSDQFGNYVAQHSLEHSGEEEKKAIISTLTLMDLFSLCCNKFASNVIEKAVRARLSDKTVLHRLIASIVQSEHALLELMKDKYGNYVVKAICDLSTSEFPEVLYVKNVLIAHSGILKRYTYGYHLVDKLERSANGSRPRADSNVSQSSGDRERRNHQRARNAH